MDGIPSPWSGALCGRALPAGCSAAVLPPAKGCEADHSLLQLTVAKADEGPSARYWRAPFRDLLPLVEARERLAEHAPRGSLLHTPDSGWQSGQTSDAFEVLMPLSADVSTVEVRGALPPVPAPRRPRTPVTLAPRRVARMQTGCCVSR